MQRKWVSRSTWWRNIGRQRYEKPRKSMRWHISWGWPRQGEREKRKSTFSFRATASGDERLFPMSSTHSETQCSLFYPWEPHLRVPFARFSWSLWNRLFWDKSQVNGSRSTCWKDSRRSTERRSLNSQRQLNLQNHFWMALQVGADFRGTVLFHNSTLLITETKSWS